MIAGGETTGFIEHGGAMIKIGVFRLLSYMLQLQIWMQLKVLMLLLEIMILRIPIIILTFTNANKKIIKIVN